MLVSASNRLRVQGHVTRGFQSVRDAFAENAPNKIMLRMIHFRGFPAQVCRNHAANQEPILRPWKFRISWN